MNEKEIKIIKSDKGFNTVLFVALVPDEEDRNGDIITAEEITKTAHDFVKNLQEKKVNIDHQDDTDIEDAHFVESYIAPCDIPVGEGEDVIPVGSWIIGIQFSDEMYQAVIDNDFVGISMEGSGTVSK